MKYPILAAVIALLLVAAPGVAQTANPSSLLFLSPDHTAIIPPGSVGAGLPVIETYQAFLFLASADVVLDAPIVNGAVVSKAFVTVAGPDLRITFAQLGLTLPACTALPCPVYDVLLRATGPGGTSVRGVAAESGPFTAALPALLPAPVPASPSSLRPA
jgi:hypothetical protein